MERKVWKPSGAWTVYEAAAIWQALTSRVGADGIDVDLSGISEIDTTGVQLLLMARRACRDQGAEMRIGACSAPVREALRLYGYGCDRGEGEVREVFCP